MSDKFHVFVRNININNYTIIRLWKSPSSQIVRNKISNFIGETYKTE